jgi:hypothetical protein
VVRERRDPFVVVEIRPWCGSTTGWSRGTGSYLVMGGLVVVDGRPAVGRMRVSGGHGAGKRQAVLVMQQCKQRDKKRIGLRGVVCWRWDSAVHMQRVVELLRFGYGARPIRATRGSRDLPALQRGDRSEAWPSGNERKTRKQRGASPAVASSRHESNASLLAPVVLDNPTLSLVHELPCRGI